MQDVTDKVEFSNPDDEYLPILKCVCGTVFKPWEFIIDIYSDVPNRCQECNKGLFFRNEIRVFEAE